MKKKSMVGWYLKGVADTFTIFKGKEIPFSEYKKFNMKKVRITIEEI